MSGRSSRSSRNAPATPPVKVENTKPVPVAKPVAYPPPPSEEPMDTKPVNGQNGVTGQKKRKALPESFKDKNIKRYKLTPRHPCSILVELGLALTECPATGDASKQEFKYSVSVHGTTLTGTGNSRQKAKEMASRNAIMHCIKTHNPEFKKLTERFNRGDGKSVYPSDEQVRQLIQTEEQVVEDSKIKSPQQILSQVSRNAPTYNLVKSDGLGTNRKCVCQLTIGNNQFQAVGRTNAGAKVQVARVALASLYKIFVPAPEMEHQNAATSFLRSTVDIFEEFLGKVPLYEVVQQNKPGEKPSCTIQLRLNDEVFMATAKCKNVAKLKVAQTALARFFDVNNEEPKSIRTNIRLFRTNMQMLALFHDTEHLFEVSEDEEAGTYIAKLTINGQDFTATTGKEGGKKGAKEDAARIALQMIYHITIPSELNIQQIESKTVQSCVLKKAAIAILAETMKTPVTFNYEETDGPPFTCFAHVENTLFKAQGPNKKLAKEEVARKILNDVCHINDQVIQQRMCGLSTLDILRSPVVKGVPDEQKGSTSLLYEKAGGAVSSCAFGDDGPPPNKYTAEIMVGDRKFTGVGKSKKEAKSDASTIALKQLFGIVHNQVSPTPVGLIAKSDNVKNPITVLYEKAGQGCVTFNDLGEEGDPQNKTFSVNVTVGEKEFVGTGSNKKKAKAEACRKALQDLYNIQSDFLGVTPRGEGFAVNTTVNNAVPKPPKVSAIKSPVMALNEKDKDAKGNPVKHEFILVTERGTAPNLVFVMKVVIKGRTYIGEGPSKQAAKQAAATKALKAAFPEAAAPN